MAPMLTSLRLFNPAVPTANDIRDMVLNMIIANETGETTAYGRGVITALCSAYIARLEELREGRDNPKKIKTVGNNDAESLWFAQAEAGFREGIFPHKIEGPIAEGAVSGWPDYLNLNCQHSVSLLAEIARITGFMSGRNVKQFQEYLNKKEGY